MATGSYFVCFWDMTMEEMELGKTYKGNIYTGSIWIEEVD